MGQITGIDELISFAKEEIEKRGYEFKGMSGSGVFRAYKNYPKPTGPRNLYFRVIKCRICLDNYLIPKWSNSTAHKLCRMKEYNDERKAKGPKC